MPDLAGLASFFLASILLAMSPGPDNFYVLAQSATRGAKAGLWITLGLCTGLLVHTTLVSLGLAALIKKAPAVLEFIKLVGAGYLFYLALSLWRSRPQSIFGQSYEEGLARLYRKGVFLNLTNPKVSLFFLAFLPQFVVEPGWPASQQLFLLGGLFILSALVVFGAFSVLGGVFTGYLNRHPDVLLKVNRLAALSLVTVAWFVVWNYV